jgi:hypothetical protein
LHPVRDDTYDEAGEDEECYGANENISSAKFNDKSTAENLTALVDNKGTNMEHWWNDNDRAKLSIEHWWNDTDGKTEYGVLVE